MKKIAIILAIFSIFINFRVYPAGKNGEEYFLLSGLSENEKLKMAIQLSWEGKFKESIIILKEILRTNPLNLEAKIHLAKVFSWMGNLKDAYRETKSILHRYPDNRDALFIKANILSWRGDNFSAFKIYRKLLRERDEFDVRLAFSYAILATGDVREAKKIFEILKPTQAYQEKEFEELKRIVQQKMTPAIQINTGYSYLKSSDENIVPKGDLRYTLSIQNWNFNIDYKYIQARDNYRVKVAKMFNINSYYRDSKYTGAGLRVGLVSMKKGTFERILTGGANLEILIPRGNMGFFASRDILAETAQLLENRIRFAIFGLSFYQTYPSNISLFSAINYKTFSDKNSAIDFQSSAIYFLSRKTGKSIGVGYRLKFMDFKIQSKNGYFDPDDFVSGQLLWPFYYETGKIHVSLEPFVGFQTFKRYGKRNTDLVGGGYFTGGFKLSRNVSLELSAEGGNYAAQTAAGWKYYLIGIRLFIRS